MSISNSIGMFVVAYAVTFAVSNGLAGIMTAGAAVSRWFVRSRGRALGITMIGTSAALAVSGVPFNSRGGPDPNSVIAQSSLPFVV